MTDDAKTVVVNQQFEGTAGELEPAELRLSAVKETKPGVKTTEFWATQIVAFLTFLNAVPGIPEKYRGFVVAALEIAYALSRGLAKNGVPHVEDEPAT